jgi:hypothetical protein
MLHDAKSKEFLNLATQQEQNKCNHAFIKGKNIITIRALVIRYNLIVVF